MEGGVFDRVPVAGILIFANGIECRSSYVGYNSLVIGVVHPPGHM